MAVEAAKLIFEQARRNAPIETLPVCLVGPHYYPGFNAYLIPGVYPIMTDLAVEIPTSEITPPAEVVPVTPEQVARIAANTLEQGVTQRLDDIQLAASIILRQAQKEGHTDPLLAKAVATLQENMQGLRRTVLATQVGIETGLNTNEAVIRHQTNSGEDQQIFDVEAIAKERFRTLGSKTANIALTPEKRSTEAA